MDERWNSKINRPNKKCDKENIAAFESQETDSIHDVCTAVFQCQSRDRFHRSPSARSSDDHRSPVPENGPSRHPAGTSEFRFRNPQGRWQRHKTFLFVCLFCLVFANDV